MTVQLEYINHLLKIFPIMLALCLMLSVTYYAQNYAGIIGWSLIPDQAFLQDDLNTLCHWATSIHSVYSYNSTCQSVFKSHLNQALQLHMICYIVRYHIMTYARIWS